jgi:hypothetical protein
MCRWHRPYHLWATTNGCIGSRTAWPPWRHSHGAEKPARHWRWWQRSVHQILAHTHTPVGTWTLDTGWHVCALLWNKNERELLSCHGFTQNQLTLWKYPLMVKMTNLLAIPLVSFSWLKDHWNSEFSITIIPVTWLIWDTHTVVLSSVQISHSSATQPTENWVCASETRNYWTLLPLIYIRWTELQQNGFPGS